MQVKCMEVRGKPELVVFSATTFSLLFHLLAMYVLLQQLQSHPNFWMIMLPVSKVLPVVE